MRNEMISSPETYRPLLPAQRASSKRSNGEYVNDLELPTSDRQLFNHLKLELQKHGHLLKHNVNGEHSFPYSICGDKGFFPRVSLGLAEAFLKQLREMP